MVAEAEAVGRTPGGFLKKLGPGLITGVSDDDPSGIATYSHAGAQFGFGLGWTLILSYPLMSAIQEASARLGRITGRGLATNLAHHYPKPLAATMVALLVIANTINASANLGAIGAAIDLVLPGPTHIYMAVTALVSAILMIFVSYEGYARFLKWLCLSIFSYVGTVLVVDIDWREAVSATLLPEFHLSSAYLEGVVAMFGTTISPYLFFWQASQEAEKQAEDPTQRPLLKAPGQSRDELSRIRLDTYVGMGLSNIVGLFIVLTTAATLHAAGQTDIQTSADAAKALEPVAGKFAFALFAAGIVGTGMLSIPVLIGSAALGICGVTGAKCGLARKPAEAPQFYLLICVAFLIAVLLNFIDVDPMKALVWSAMINGVVAVPIMALILIMIRSKNIVGGFRLPFYLTAMGWFATVLMGVLGLCLVGSLLVGW